MLPQEPVNQGTDILALLNTMKPGEPDNVCVEHNLNFDLAGLSRLWLAQVVGPLVWKC